MGLLKILFCYYNVHSGPKLSLYQQFILCIGRYFATSCFSLAVQVTSKRIVESSSDHSLMYYVNDGVYGSFNCLIFDHAVVAPLTLEVNILRCEHSSLIVCEGVGFV